MLQNTQLSLLIRTNFIIKSSISDLKKGQKTRIQNSRQKILCQFLQLFATFLLKEHMKYETMGATIYLLMTKKVIQLIRYMTRFCWQWKEWSSPVDGVYSKKNTRFIQFVRKFFQKQVNSKKYLQMRQITFLYVLNATPFLWNWWILALMKWLLKWFSHNSSKWCCELFF